MRIVALLIVMTVSSCTIPGQVALTADQCAAPAWKEMGRTDGLEGRSRSAYSNRVRYCAQFGTSFPDAWQEGYDIGLQSHCTELNGYQWGWTERRASNACPPALQAAYYRGYQRGRWEAERTHLRHRHRSGLYGTIGIGTHRVRPGIGIFIPLHAH